MLKKNLYNPIGMKLVGLPITKKDNVNRKKRNVVQLERTTASHILSITSVKANAPLIFCGRQNKALPIIRELVKMTNKPFLLIGTPRDFNDSCLLSLDIEWEEHVPRSHLKEGNGILTVSPGAQTRLELIQSMSSWDSHFLIMCLGNGLRVDQELLDQMNSLGDYVLLAESLNRCVRGSEGYKLSVEELLRSMDYVLVTSIGSSAKDLLQVLPTYEYEKITNTTDLSLHQDAPQMTSGSYHHRNGGGFRLSQSKTMEEKCIFSQDGITKMQDNGEMIIYNAKTSHTWVAKVR